VSATRPPAYDERYAAPVEASRRGAHRARPNPLTSVVPVIAGMAVVVLVVVGAFTLLGDRGASQNQRNLATTRVYYGKSSQKATADAIVAALGFGETKKSAANAGEGITIVLGEDAADA
jgi:hypothetical protein